MAKLYVKEHEITSRITWLYAVLTKSSIEVVKLDPKNVEHITANPLKIYPYLLDGDTRIWGDHAILTYIAEKYANNAWYGTSPDEKAKVNSLLYWLAGSLSRSALRNYAYPQYKESNMSKLDLESDNALLIENGHKSTSNQLNNIEQAYFNKADKKFLTGKQSIADFYLALILIEVEKFNMKLDAWPKTTSWLKELKPQIEELQAQMGGV